MLTDDEIAEVLDPILDADMESRVAKNFHRRLILKCAHAIYDRACEDCAKACVAEPKINDCDQWCCRPEREDCATDCRSLKHGDSK